MDKPLVEERREKNIDQVFHTIEIDNSVCKKFDDIGCMYVNYEYGRLYRRNNIFYYINYTDDRIYLFDENMEPILEKGWWSEQDDIWCDNCQNYFEKNKKKYYLISDFMNDKPISKILMETTYK
tara:strand:- start:23340 stop:23711 length:372 start_codon:yes stop_codon:yes gene_type:complete